MNAYKHIGYILAEALGLIEARRVHVVGSQKDIRIKDDKKYLTIPAIRGEPKTGKGGRPERLYDKELPIDITIPGPHSTGGSERGKKKKGLEEGGPTKVSESSQYFARLGRKLFENKMKELKASYERVHGKPATTIKGKTAGSIASDSLERTKKTPDKFDKKVNKLMGKKKYSDETPAQMWREIHGNAKKGVEEYKAKRDAQLKNDEKGD